MQGLLAPAGLARRSSGATAYHPRVEVLQDGVELGRALLEVKEGGASFLPAALNESFRFQLRREVDSGPFRSMSGSYGKVSMEIDGYDVEAPMDGFPMMRALAQELGIAVGSSDTGIRGLATWRPNEIGVTRYRPGSLGITPHMDGKWYRRLVAVVTVYGRSRFAICRDRRGEVVSEWQPGPGDMVLMRGPGLGGVRDGRPFHLAEGPRRGSRCSLGIRMSVNPPG